jgi:hypothetical protein
LRTGCRICRDAPQHTDDRVDQPAGESRIGCRRCAAGSQHVRDSLLDGCPVHSWWLFGRAVRGGNGSVAGMEDRRAAIRQLELEAGPTGVRLDRGQRRAGRPHLAPGPVGQAEVGRVWPRRVVGIAQDESAAVGQLERLERRRRLGFEGKRSRWDRGQPAPVRQAR